MTKPCFQNGFKPMLAFTPKDLTKIKFPVIASPKVDGIRCCIDSAGVPFTRSLKHPIKNTHIRETLQHFGDRIDELDGEIMTYDSNGRMKPLNEVNGDVSREDGKPNFMFWVFDTFEDWEMPYLDRVADYTARANAVGFALIKPLPTKLINSLDELLEYEADILAQGFEGVMYRQPDSTYKFGRSTEKEGGLGKLKRFTDAEARIIDFVELCRNENEAVTNALGRTERSSSKAGKVPANTLGALVVQMWHEGNLMTFEIGTGFNAKLRQQIWDNRHNELGRLVTFKYREVMKDAPVLTVFKAFRDEDDAAVAA